MTVADPICRCGHHRSAHYDHERTRYNCLAVHCDCELFKDENERPTDPGPTVFQVRRNYRKPHADPGCYCDACMHWHRFGWVYR